MIMDIKNKVVLITGSSSGIGKATAIAFAKEGAKVVVNYHINEEGAKETKAEIVKLGGACMIVKADVSKPKEIDFLFEEAVKEYKTVDILINNAAIPTDRVPYLEASPEEIQDFISTDLIGPMLCTKKAIEIMQKQGYGKILNTSSVRGWEYGGRSVVYAASKAGIISFTRTLAKMVAPNIQVNSVAPGFVKTRVYDKMSDEQCKNFLEQTQLKRWIMPEEIADAFIFLAKSDAMTGQVIYVDAGFCLK